jgi:hypothetical protein
MAAPVGYSVQVAQGTGLGASVAAVPLGAAAVVTGNSDRDLRESDLPPAPSGGVGRGKGGHGGPDGGGGGGGAALPAVPPPIVTAHAYVPPPAEKKDGDFDEVDIFVPGAGGGGEGAGFGPSAPPGSTLTSPSSSAASESQRGTGNHPSYDDLAARFNQLKK